MKRIPGSRAALFAGAVLIAGCGGDPDLTSSDVLGNETYISNATTDGVITLVGGAFDFPAGASVERVELVTSAEGDFDGDDEIDAAVVLVEHGARERYYRLHALLSDGKEVEDVSARLLGDRIVVENLRVVDGMIEVDMMIRAPGANVEADPVVPITNRFALTGRGLVPINPPTIKEGATPAMGSGDVATLVSHEWILQSIEMGDWNQSTDALEERPALRFATELGTPAQGTGTVSGYAGCNQLFGGYSNQSTGALGLSGLATTRKVCPEAMIELEQRVVASLAASETFQITDDQLVIVFNGGTLRFSAGSEIDPPSRAAAWRDDGAPSTKTTDGAAAGRQTT